MTIDEKINTCEHLIQMFKYRDERLYKLSKSCLYCFVDVKENPLTEASDYYNQTLELFIELISLV